MPKHALFIFYLLFLTFTSFIYNNSNYNFVTGFRSLTLVTENSYFSHY
jgi:hypothetical protein